MIKMKLALIIGVCISSFAIAQSTHVSKLNPVEKEGYYNIKLSQEIIGEGQSDLRDLRLIDAESKPVPYYLFNGKTLHRDTVFKTLKIKEFDKYQRGILSKQLYSELIVENQDTLLLNELYLEINNAQVRKRIRLSGSENNKDWFSIKDHCRYKITPGNSNTQILQILDFPIVNYKYIKIVMRDYTGDPIKINKVGFYEYSTEELPKDTTVLADYKLINNHEDKKSVYEVSLPYNYNFELLNIQLKGADFYKRQVNIYIADTLIRNNKEVISQRNIARSICTSEISNSITIQGSKTNHYIIEIINNDNSPLELDQIFGINNPVYAVAKLNQNDFKFELGDDKLSKPKYDLVNFKNKIGIERDIVSTQELRSLVSLKPSSDNFLPSWIIWTVLIAVFGVLFVFSFKMIKEMNDK